MGIAVSAPEVAEEGESRKLLCFGAALALESFIFWLTWGFADTAIRVFISVSVHIVETLGLK